MLVPRNCWQNKAGSLTKSNILGILKTQRQNLMSLFLSGLAVELKLAQCWHTWKATRNLLIWTEEFLRKYCVMLLTGASSGLSGCQSAAGGRGRAKQHRRSDGMALRAHLLTSHMGDPLGGRGDGRREGRRKDEERQTGRWDDTEKTKNIKVKSWKRWGWKRFN